MTRDAVVAQLLAHPEARDAWVVLSDLLQQEGNPRGELLALELALDERKDEALAARHQAFFGTHAAVLCGDLLSQVLAEGYGKATWSRGYVKELSYVGAGLGYQRKVKWLVKAICTQPEALTFLRKLDFTKTDLDDPAPLGCFKGLRELDLSGTAVKKLDWVEHFPSLKVVSLNGCKLMKNELSAARAQWPRVQFG